MVAKLRLDPDVDRQLADALADTVEHGGLDPLGWGRCRLPVFNADEQVAAGTVGEAHAVAGQLREVRRRADDALQRLSVHHVALVVGEQVHGGSVARGRCGRVTEGRQVPSSSRPAPRRAGDAW